MFQGAWKVSISMQIKNSINENCTICKESQMRMTIANVSEISLYLLAQEKPLIVRFVSLTETCSANSSLLEVGVVGVAGSQGPVCFSVYPSTFYCFIHSSVKKFWGNLRIAARHLPATKHKLKRVPNPFRSS